MAKLNEKEFEILANAGSGYPKTLNPEEELAQPQIQQENISNQPPQPQIEAPGPVEEIPQQPSPMDVATGVSPGVDELQQQPLQTEPLDPVQTEDRKISPEMKLPPGWQPPKKRKDLRWLAALGMGLSGMGVAVAGKGDVGQATSLGANVLANWDRDTQNKFMMDVANDPLSPMSVEARQVANIKNKDATWAMLEPLMPSLMADIARKHSLKMAKDAMNVRQQDRINTDRRLVSKEFNTKAEKLSDMTNLLDRIQDLMGFNLGAYDYKTHTVNGQKVKDLPGANAFKRWAQTEEAKQFNTFIQALSNYEIKQLSGAAVNEHEMKRIKAAMGTGLLYTDSVALAALKRIRDGIHRKMLGQETYLKSSQAAYDEVARTSPHQLPSYLEKDYGTGGIRVGKEQSPSGAINEIEQWLSNPKNKKNPKYNDVKSKYEREKR